MELHWHAVAVTQVANQAWANPQDTRSQSVWQPIGRNFTGGPTYDPMPTVAGAMTRKAPGLDPKAADFATAG